MSTETPETVISSAAPVAATPAPAPVPKPKPTTIKVKAKCKTCRKRLWTNRQQGLHCKQGHAVNAPVEFQTPKPSDSIGPKWRRKGGVKAAAPSGKKR